MRKWRVVLAGTFGLMLATGVFAVQRTGPAHEPPEPIALERPDDPPLVLSVQRPQGPALSNVVYSRGPWISTQVNIDQFGNNIPGDAANEPSLTIDPTNPQRIAIGWRQFDTIASNFRQGGWAHSQDAGQTWTFPGVLEPGQFRSDPVLASDADGNFYYSSLSAVDSAQVFKSTDGGVTWPTVADAFGGDKQWIAVDRTGGIGSGNIYQIWNVQFTCCQPNDFTRSTNGGASFAGPFAVPTPSMKWGTMDVGPDGTLYLAGAALSTSNGHLFTKSANAQDPAQTPTFAATQSINLGGLTSFAAPPNPAGLLGQVWIATDHSDTPTRGNIYILASVNPPDFLVSDPLDVKFIRSTDDGQTWSSPKRVNDDPFSSPAWQWFGTIAVAPNGRIDAVWNDTRNSGADNISELFYAYSTDAGQTWSKNIPVSPAFDSHLGWPSQDKLGDYYGMISDSAAANVVYAATFNGEQDVYFLRVGDCNHNGTHDGEELAAGIAFDDNNNGVIDSCECPADLDGNGEVRVPDLIILLSAWGPNPGHFADLDGDGEVRVPDLVILLAAWGACQ